MLDQFISYFQIYLSIWFFNQKIVSAESRLGCLILPIHQFVFSASGSTSGFVPFLKKWHTVLTTEHRFAYLEQNIVWKAVQLLNINKLSYWWVNKLKLRISITYRCNSLLYLSSFSDFILLNVCWAVCTFLFILASTAKVISEHRPINAVGQPGFEPETLRLQDNHDAHYAAVFGR